MKKLRYPTDYIAIVVYYKKSDDPKKRHMGVDLGWNSKYGGQHQPIYAPADGKVVATKDKDKTGKSWGNYVKIYVGKYNGKKMYVLMAHLEDGLKVKKGQKVKMGALLGKMGNTGKASGPHCHYEVYLGGSATKYRVDPEKYTYVYNDQKVSKNKSATKGLKYAKESKTSSK